MILVAGGTGTVGHKVVQALLAKNVPVRLIARGHCDWKESIGPEFRRLGVEVFTGDLGDASQANKAVQGCQAIINAAGILRDLPGYTMEAGNVTSVENLIAAAKEFNVQRFVHLSCLGSTEYSQSRYLSSKWHGESLVKRESLYWTIFRPSLIFSDRCHLTQALDFWVSHLPFLPVVGSGINHIQPISADDVADCILQCLYNRDTVGKVYDLVGPKSFTLTELLELASARYGKKKPYIKLSAPLGYALARLIEKLNPKAPIYEEVVKLMTSDLEGDSSAMLATFQVSMLPIDSALRPVLDWRTQ